MSKTGPATVISVALRNTDPPATIAAMESAFAWDISVLSIVVAFAAPTKPTRSADWAVGIDKPTNPMAMTTAITIKKNFLPGGDFITHPPFVLEDVRLLWLFCRIRSEEHTSELQSHVNLVCR